ncbi:MAG TPA: phosphate ABC transporter substrate-binding protein PstS [Streptosporangiaceae bacterium]|nr:phosphate ABC transporter substrate-binding protein PstS [Streptosporangiaceae bacterium]
MTRLFRLAIAGAATTLLLWAASLGAGAGSAEAVPNSTHVAIDGSGSSWAALAIDQWTSTLANNGLTINYSPIGSATGREQYIQGLDDFAGSDPPFRNGGDKIAQTPPEVSHYGYSYIPDTAGGTAFMYHLDVAGKQITNLRLTGEEIMEIFTGKITNWDDQQITKTYGMQLPNLPITPVVRTDGSGATFFFTRWMEHEFPTQWNNFCYTVTSHRVTPPCPETEFYPTNGPGWNAKGENGSTAVADYITSSYANGAIGYDEYAYAINSHYPVVQILNPAGYFVLPTASNVAVALTQAQIDENPKDPNFLQQNLNNVYTYTDPRSYPLSSYSYLIVPREGTAEPPRFSTQKGATLSTFTDYMLCAGQQDLAQLGYSPLPLNLVKGGLLQADHIPGHIAGPNLNTLHGCDNPTFTGNELILLKNAPEPSPCAKEGEPLNCVVVDGKATSPGGGSSPSASPSASSTSGSTSSTSPTDTGGPTDPGGTTATGGDDPGAGGTDPSGGSTVAGTVVNVSNESASPGVLAVLTVAAILAAVVLPPVLGASLRRRRRQSRHG